MVKKKRVRTEEEGCKWVPGEREVVGLSTGWAGRAQSPAGWVRDEVGGAAQLRRRDKDRKFSMMDLRLRRGIFLSLSLTFGEIFPPLFFLCHENIRTLLAAALTSSRLA